MLVSCEVNNIKIWDICLLNLINVYENGQIFSSCFLNDVKMSSNYIVTNNYNFFGHSGPIKIYDLKGNIIKKINDSEKYVKSIKAFYVEELLTNYIIS